MAGPVRVGDLEQSDHALLVSGKHHEVARNLIENRAAEDAIDGGCRRVDAERDDWVELGPAELAEQLQRSRTFPVVRADHIIHDPHPLRRRAEPVELERYAAENARQLAIFFAERKAI